MSRPSLSESNTCPDYFQSKENAMKSLCHLPSSATTVLTTLALLCAFQQQAQAITDLADVPLSSANASLVLPNIELLLDDSGSMTWVYMPDSMPALCRNTSGTATTCSTSLGGTGAVGFYTAAINGVYYDPSVTYAPPVDATGSPLTASNGWKCDASMATCTFTAVPYDGYGVISTGTRNLATNYPQLYYCTGTSYSASTCKDAVDNSTHTYRYPDSTYSNTVTNKVGGPQYFTATPAWCDSASSALIGGDSHCQATQNAGHSYRGYLWTVTHVESATPSYAKAATRTDCAGTTCTYNEEMRNFANWHAWYQYRGTMLKSTLLLALKDVRGTPNPLDPTDSNYIHARIGMTAINKISGTSYGNYSSPALPINIADFNSAQHSSIYNAIKLLPSPGNTPTVPALRKVGEMFKQTGASAPIQYSCQRNYTILATDGMWNDNSGGDTPPISNPDAGCSTVSPPPLVQCGATCAAATRPECDINRMTLTTLADVAYYYYHTDLRTDLPDNVPAAGTDVTMDDVAPWQHMTTITIGLGVNGVLNYQPDYKSATSGDFYSIRTGGGKNWPPITSGATGTGPEKADDLWHAAVNGRGTYFAVKNPQALTSALQQTLSAINAAKGSGSAAAISTLIPTSGNNYAYIASYRTVYWDGNVAAYTLNPTTGNISATPLWQAEPQLTNNKITTTGGTEKCGDGDNRTIWFTRATDAAGAAFRNFLPTELTTEIGAGWFNNNNLSQHTDWSVTPTSDMLINYLRGQSLNENKTRSATWVAACPSTYQLLYRARDNVLGDIVHAAPVYVGEPPYSYDTTISSNSGYDSFQSSNTSRAGRIYVGANDGMVHAFDSSNGQEMWAYIPPTSLPELYKLADKGYSGKHQFFVDGPITYGDIKVSGTWKSIIVGALGKGGRGIYALDVTAPASPKFLWTVSYDRKADGSATGAGDPLQNLGYTYGTPRITKLDTGAWVVVMASGYNNVSPGDGQGHVFVFDANTGELLNTINTNAGSTSNPAGLAQLNGYVPDVRTDNTPKRVYGGDLLGNLWSLDINVSGGDVRKLATLPAGQPITVAPLVSIPDATNVILYFGTGKYLGISDLSTAGMSTQTIYAIKDSCFVGETFTSSSCPGTPVTQANLVAQPMSGSVITPHTVNWATDAGWYVNLPAKESVNLSAQKYGSVLAVASYIPSADVCSPGGDGYLYLINTDAFLGGTSSSALLAKYHYNAPLAGFTVFRIEPNPSDPKVPGEGRLLVIDGGGNAHVEDALNPDKLGTGGAVLGTRVIWQELLEAQ
jgi:type IV pilus assembly protein PilY1